MLDSRTHNQLPEALWKQAPLFSYLVCCIIGGIVGTFVGLDIMGWTIIACLCSAISIIGYLRFKDDRRKRCLPWLFASLTIIFTFASLTQNAWHKVKIDWNDKQQIWLGQVINIQKKGDKSCTYDVELQPSSACHKQCNVRLFLQKEHTLLPNVGDKIAFAGIIKIRKEQNYPGEFDFSNYLLTHNISGYCYVKKGRFKVLPIQENVSLKIKMLRIRQRLINTYAHYFSNTNLAILSALTLGDKSMLTTDIRNMFSQTGTNHILALSGLHLSIIFAVFNLMFMPIFKNNRRTRYIGSMCILLMLWMFVLLSGCSLSLIRAACMLSFIQIGKAMRRSEGNGINNLSLSGIIILLCDPLALFDVSFQLSFAAVFAILLCNLYVWKRFYLPTWKKDKDPTIATKTCKSLYLFFRNTIYPFVTISLSAQWGTLPLVAHYFHSFSPYTIIANFIVIPAAYLLLCGALIFFIIPIKAVQLAMAWCMECVLSILTKSLNFFASWPGSMLHIHATIFTLMLVIVLPIIIYALFETRRRKMRKNIIICFFSLISLSLIVEYIWNTTQSFTPCVIVYKTPHSTIVHFIHSKQLSYLFSNNNAQNTHTKLSYIEQNFWHANNMKSPLLLRDNKKNPTLAHSIYKNENLIVFNNKRIYILSPYCQITKQPNATLQPLPIDILVVEEGCKIPYKDINTYFKPKQIVLSYSLSSRMKKAWQNNCKQSNIPCWDIYENGAYIQYFSKDTPDK